jgi:hypothetical protein
LTARSVIESVNAPNMMRQTTAAKIADAQAPANGALNIDHVAHFVPHMDNAAPVLEKLGFTLTSFSAQSHRLETGGPLVPVGSGNRCVMFRRGYLECLTPTASTQIAEQLRAAIKRYVGVHLVAFGTSAPELDYSRLAAQGFSPLAPVELQRTITATAGEEIARFTVVRVPPGIMTEGRIQFCRHHTPELLWQPQWLAHDNHAVALTAVILCVADPAEAAARYSRFTGLGAKSAGDICYLDTARGRLLFCPSAVLKRKFGVDAPALPWIAGYVLASGDMSVTRNVLTASGYAYGELDSQRLYVVPPSSLGGIIVFEPEKCAALDLGAHAV